MPGSSSRLVGIGVFVLGGIALFVTGLFLIGQRQLAFTPKFTVYAEFARLNGLEVGDTVQVSGMQAGEVKTIGLPKAPGQKFRLALEIRSDLHPLVRTDSVATIETQGLIGSTYLQVSSGTAHAPEVAPGGLIGSREPFDFADLVRELGQTVDLVNETVKNIQGNVVRIVRSVADVASNAQQIISEVGANLRRITAAGVRVARDIRRVADDIRDGRGTIGKLVTDDTLYRQITKLTKTAGQIAGRVRDVIAQARQLLVKLQGSSGRVEGLTSNLQETLDSARSALGDMSDAMDALKHNFLLRGFFRARGYYDLTQLSPSEYEQGVLERGNREKLRIWLRADVLFKTTRDGVEELTDGGKVRLDSAMAGFLPYLPDAVLVVEGYATAGSQAQRFLTARDRAATVRAYLVDRFHLDPRTTGLMPLGAAAPDSPSGTHTWSGVAVSLFVSRDRLSTRH